MFQGDRRFDHIRGREGISLTRYLEYHSHISFAIIHIYKCACGYGPTDHQVVGFSNGRLVEDSAVATSTEQKIYLCETLRGTIRDLMTLHPVKFRGFSKDEVREWCHMPYFPFYINNKTFLELANSSELEPERSAELELLCGWFEVNLRSDWDEAAELFSRGRVTLKHCHKLFVPSELVVTPRQMHNDQGLIEVIQVCDYPWKDQTDKIVDAISWTFNGAFQKVARWINPTSNHPRLPWEGEIDITSLPYYPLRFAHPNLKKKLTSRGQRFWSCRKNRLVAAIQETVEGAEFDPVSLHLDIIIHLQKSILLSLAKPAFS
jgi:hypothetical protein